MSSYKEHHGDSGWDGIKFIYSFVKGRHPHLTVVIHKNIYTRQVLSTLKYLVLSFISLLLSFTIQSFVSAVVLCSHYASWNIYILAYSPHIKHGLAVWLYLPLVFSCQPQQPHQSLAVLFSCSNFPNYFEPLGLCILITLYSSHLSFWSV